jgi:hypothetical protein
VQESRLRVVANDRGFRRHLVKLRLEGERKQARLTNEKRTQETSRCRGSPEGEEEVLRLGVVAIQYNDARHGH